MKADVPLDFVIFHLTPPARTRCELLVARGNETEKLASGLLKPFLSHLKTAEEQIAKGGDSIQLQPPPGYGGLGRSRGGSDSRKPAWFTKGTIERFVRFVSTPEVLEHVSTVEAELMQLEETINNQANESSQVDRTLSHSAAATQSAAGGRGLLSLNSDKAAAQMSKSTWNSFDGGDNPGPDDGPRRRLLRAMDARKMLLQKEQGLAFARASAAGFDMQHMERLLVFSDCFGATRLRDACVKYMAICKKSKEAGLWIDEMEFAAPEAMGPPRHMPASSDTMHRESSDMWADLQNDGGDMRLDDGGDNVTARSHTTGCGNDLPKRGFSSSEMHRKRGAIDVPISAMSPTKVRDISGEYRPRRTLQGVGDDVSAVAYGQEIDARSYTEDNSSISNSGSRWPTTTVQSSHSAVPTHVGEPGTDLDDAAKRSGRTSHRPRRAWGPPQPHVLAKPEQSRGGPLAFEDDDEDNAVARTNQCTSVSRTQIVQDANQGCYPENGNGSLLLGNDSEGLPSWALVQDHPWRPTASCDVEGPGYSHHPQRQQGREEGTDYEQMIMSQNTEQSHHHDREAQSSWRNTSAPAFDELEQKGATGNTGAAAAVAAGSLAAGNQAIHSGLQKDDSQSGVEQEAQSFIDQVRGRRLPRRATSPRKRSPSPMRRVQVAHPSLRGRSGAMMKHVNYLTSNANPSLKRNNAKESESSESGTETDEFDSALDYEVESLPKQGESAQEDEGAGTFANWAAADGSPSSPGRGRQSRGWNAATTEYEMESGNDELADQKSAENDTARTTVESVSPKESKGRFYEQYREKRDAKLRKEMGSKKAEREAKLKSMQDVLERRKAEMAARSGRLSEKFVVTGAEKLPMVVKPEMLKNKEEKGEEEEVKRLEELSVQRRERITAHSSSPKSVSTVSAVPAAKQPLTTTTAQTPAPTASAAVSKPRVVSKQSPPKKGATGAALRSTAAISSSSPSPSAAPKITWTSQKRSQSSTKQVNASENPLSRSVPSLAELRKENKKPSLVRTSTYTDRALQGSKTNNTVGVGRPAPVPLEATNGSRPTPRASSTTDDKKRQTNGRKSLAVVSESPTTTTTTTTKEAPASTPLKASKAAPAVDSKTASKPVASKRLSMMTGAPATDSKPFLRKGRGLGPGVAASLRRSKVASAPDVVERSPDDESCVTTSSLPVPSVSAAELPAVESSSNNSKQTEAVVSALAVPDDGIDMDAQTGLVAGPAHEASSPTVAADSQACTALPDMAGSQEALMPVEETEETREREQTREEEPAPPKTDETMEIEETREDKEQASPRLVQVSHEQHSEAGGTVDEEQHHNTSFERSGDNLPSSEGSEPFVSWSEPVAPPPPNADVELSYLQSTTPYTLSSATVVSLPPAEPRTLLHSLLLSSPDKGVPSLHVSNEAHFAVVLDSSSICDAAPVTLASGSSPSGGSPVSQQPYPQIQRSRSPEPAHSNTSCLHKKKQVVGGSSQISGPPPSLSMVKEPPRGLKRLLKFGRKKISASSSTAAVVTEWPSTSSPSEGDEDMDVASGERCVWLLEDSHVKNMGVSSSRAPPKNSSSMNAPPPAIPKDSPTVAGSESKINSIPFVRTSIPTPPPNFKLREDRLSGGGSMLKAPRSFFSLSSFRGKSK